MSGTLPPLFWLWKSCAHTSIYVSIRSVRTLRCLRFCTSGREKANIKCLRRRSRIVFIHFYNLTHTDLRDFFTRKFVTYLKIQTWFKKTGLVEANSSSSLAIIWWSTSLFWGLWKTPMTPELKQTSSISSPMSAGTLSSRLWWFKKWFQ